MENEFGFVGPNEKYMRHLVGTVRTVLGDDLIIYTTDPPPNIAAGSLADDSVYRRVSTPGRLFRDVAIPPLSGSSYANLGQVS